MNSKPALAGELRDQTQLVDRVNRAEFGGLRNADCLRLGRVQIAVPRNNRSDFSKIKFAIRTACREKFRSTREKLGPAALIRHDMGILVANDAVKWATKLCEGERVCRRAVESEID